MTNVHIPVLIGGANDRRLVPDDDRMEFSIIIPPKEKLADHIPGAKPADLTPAKHDRYRRERVHFRLSDNEKMTVSFFVHTSLRPEEAFQRLLHSYSGKLK